MHLYLIIVVLCIARIAVSVWRVVFSPLSKVPGPFLARFTNGWYFWRVRKGHFEIDNIALHRKYGELVRYGPYRYSIDNPNASKTVYGLGTAFAKSSWYRTWSNPDPAAWSIFTDQSIQRHAANRRQYQSAYSLSSLVTYEPFVDTCADLFTRRLTELADATLPFNMGHWFQCYAFDVIGLITYSKRIGFLDQGDDIGGVLVALEDHMRYATLTGIYSFLHPYLFPLRNWFAGKHGVGRAYIMDFTREIMAEHQSRPKAVLPEEQSGSVDFLTKFFSKHAEDPEAFTMYHALMGCTSNMVAGSDTTAISLSAVLYYLLKSPETYETLRREVHACQESESPCITFKETQAMPYLHAVIKEALRMHPAVGLPLERVVPAGGATICDHFFPEGTIVGINCWTMHRNPAVFGSDADEFRPERWMVDDIEKLAYMDRHWMPFGLGSRTCIGRHISFLEISKLIPRLVRDFDFELCGEIKEPKCSWSTTNSWFVKPRDFVLVVKSRRERRKGLALRCP